MTAHKLIGFHGWGRCGKDSAAGFLVERGWERRAFADPLRDLAAAADPIVGSADGEYRTYTEYLNHYGYDEAKSHGDFRPFLQRLGDGARKVFGDDFWVDMAVANLTTDTAWADVRYSGEGDAIKSRGGIVIKIEREGCGPANAFEAEHHAMEDYPFDTVIHNNGSLALLRETVLEIATWVLPK